MKPPYDFRIVAALPGGPTIELMRSKAHEWQHAWDSYTRDISPEWNVWMEHPTPNKSTITPRIKVGPYNNSGKIRLHLDLAEKRRAGV